MMDDIEIQRCAQFLLKEYGAEESRFRAVQRADACLANGEQEGQRQWLRVVAKLEDLIREGRKSAAAAL
jgi:hypothetical protein